MKKPGVRAKKKSAFSSEPTQFLLMRQHEQLLDYECKTTFWEDFKIAEAFGEAEIRDTYKRARADWGKDREYGTELSMVLNHKCWYFYENGDFKLSKLYADLWEEYHYWVLDNWQGEDLGYYLRTTD